MLVNPLMEEVRRRYLTPEIQKQVDLQVMIANRVYDLLEAKGMTQKDFAAKLGKTETEVSRWLCGTHNLTMATIAKMAVALEDDLIVSTRTKVSKRKLTLMPKRVAAVL
ncbi:MAG: helix-turn-helix transcriptional regulator [Bacteroidales bacterium]|nr:helix-turn-helix transcriptional regulator [Bacteroidales bacterium]